MLEIKISCEYEPAERFLRSSGMKTDDKGLWVFQGDRSALYGMQHKLHLKANGACLLFRHDGSGTAFIAKCQAHPGPYEGPCLEAQT